MKIRFPLFISLAILLTPSQYLLAKDTLFYQITGVKNWDTLNLRSSPGISSKVIAKIPANGNTIRQTGERVSVGKTVWVKIIWQGKQGWASKSYLQVMNSGQAKAKEDKPNPVKKIALKEAGSGEWILSCGNSSPFWKVEVHPKILKMFKGNYKAKLPITYKKQEKNKWNIAKRTHLKGASAKDRLDLDIRFSYSKCDDTLSKLKVPYKATMTHNGEEMMGCCRALKLK